MLSSTQLRVTTPPRPAGVVNVQIRTAAGLSPASAANAFAYAPVPTLTGLSPVAGPTTGGTLVTLTGTGLGLASAVQFGTSSTTQVLRVSATSIRVTSPVRPVGTVDVRVTTPGGTSGATTHARFTYGATPPSVTSLSTTAGPVSGGTALTVTGAGFSGTTRVAFGGVPSHFTVLSSTTIRVTTPPTRPDPSA